MSPSCSSSSSSSSFLILLHLSLLFIFILFSRFSSLFPHRYVHCPWLSLSVFVCVCPTFSVHLRLSIWLSQSLFLFLFPSPAPLPSVSLPLVSFDVRTWLSGRRFPLLFYHLLASLLSLSALSDHFLVCHLCSAVFILYDQMTFDCRCGRCCPAIPALWLLSDRSNYYPATSAALQLVLLRSAVECLVAAFRLVVLSFLSPLVSSPTLSALSNHLRLAFPVRALAVLSLRPLSSLRLHFPSLSSFLDPFCLLVSYFPIFCFEPFSTSDM